MYNFKTATPKTLAVIIERIELWLNENRYTNIDRSFVMANSIVYVLTDDRAYRFGTDGVVLAVEDDDPYVIGGVPSIPNILRLDS